MRADQCDFVKLTPRGFVELAGVNMDGARITGGSGIIASTASVMKYGLSNARMAIIGITIVPTFKPVQNERIDQK